ncbi:hypothetical protein B0H19DRAFT_1080551 [Mycena capillaripes]|nr:hypothetical protein B0H19DRAFT_1080551 [Mycena capillaripes]
MLRLRITQAAALCGFLLSQYRGYKPVLCVWMSLDGLADAAGTDVADCGLVLFAMGFKASSALFEGRIERCIILAVRHGFHGQIGVPSGALATPDRKGAFYVQERWDAPKIFDQQIHLSIGRYYLISPRTKEESNRSGLPTMTRSPISFRRHNRTSGK